MRRQPAAETFKEWLETESVGDSLVFCLDDFGCELSQTIERLVRQTRAADNGKRITTVCVHKLVQLFGGEANGFVPGSGDQLTALLVANQRRANSFLVVDKRMAETAFDA